MTQLRRAIIALSAAAACAGTGLTLATNASAAPPPASWGCEKQKSNDAPVTYSVYCVHMPSGHQVRVVMNCKIFATGKTAQYLGPWVNNLAISEVPASSCTSRDGYVTTYGPRAG